MKTHATITDFEEISISNVIRFYDEYDITRVVFIPLTPTHGYLRFYINGETPDGNNSAATTCFTHAICAELAKEIRDTNNIHLNNEISDIHEISFENFGNLLV